MLFHRGEISCEFCVVNYCLPSTQGWFDGVLHFELSHDSPLTELETFIFFKWKEILNHAMTITLWIIPTALNNYSLIQTSS